VSEGFTPRTFVIKDAFTRSKIAGAILKLDARAEWDITIRRHVRRRTLRQNSRLHLLFSMVSSETGNDIEDVKEGYKALFLQPKIVDLSTKRVLIYPRTSKMNVAELNEFMTRVEVHAIENFGIVLGDGDGWSS
jgi:hypothetical protein